MSAHCSDLLIHIDESLDDDAIHRIEYDLAQLGGVYCACVPERARHLMLVDYDPEDVAPGQLLGQVRRYGLHAELVGL